MATSSAALPKSATPARGSARRWKPRTRWIILAVLAAALLLGAFLWVRDSSLVGVEQVEITGATGTTSRAVERAITDAARQMTTMDFDPAAIRHAVAPYPIVKSIEVRTRFPHRVDVVVRQHVPVATIVFGGKDVPVAADGTVLDGTAAKGIPPLATDRPPVGGRITERAVRQQIRVLAAASAAQRADVQHVQQGSHGVELRLHSTDAAVYFGDGEEARDQWVALRRVLADPGSAGATYIDVRVPERPAAGGFAAGLGTDASDGSDPADGAGAATSGDGSATTDDGSGDVTSDDGTGDDTGM